MTALMGLPCARSAWMSSQRWRVRLARPGSPAGAVAVAACRGPGTAWSPGLVPGPGPLRQSRCRGDGPFRVLGQVVPQVPPAGHLDRGRRAGAGALGESSGPVPADHLGAGMPAQPGRQGIGLPVREQVNGPPGLHVDQDRAVGPAAAEREVIHAQHPHRPRLRDGQRHQQPQHEPPPGRHPQRGGQPRPGPPGQRRRDRAQRRGQRRGPARVPRGQARDLLGERPPVAARRRAEEPADGQPDHHPPPANRRISQPPAVTAVNPGRRHPARRARSLPGTRPRPDAQQPGGHHDSLDDHPGQVRQDNPQLNHTRA